MRQTQAVFYSISLDKDESDSIVLLQRVQKDAGRGMYPDMFSQQLS